MNTKPEKFKSISKSTKESLVNMANRRGWKVTVKRISDNCFDLTLHVPADYEYPEY